MMRVSKRWAVGLTASSLLAGLSACSDGPGKPRQSSKPAPAPAAQKAAVSAQTPPPVPVTDRIATTALRERAIELIEQLSQSSDPQVRANACEAASYAAPRLQDVITRALHDPSPGVRSVALMSVGRARLTGLAGEANSLLNDQTPQVRAGAIYALARCDMEVSRTPLAGMLLDDPSPWVRRHAAYVLGELGDPSAVALLRSAANDPFKAASAEQYKNFQLQIAEAMAKLGDPKARQVIRAALYPSRPEELEATALATQIIGEIKDREAIDQLVVLSAYRDGAGNMYPGEIRLGVASSLAQMGNAKGGFIADEYSGSDRVELRAQAATVYGLIGGGDSLGRLKVLMEDPAPTVRVAASGGVLRALSGDGR